MASLLDSVGASSSFARPIAASSTSAISSMSGRRVASARLPEFRGLKIRPIPVNRSSTAFSQGSIRRQEIALGGRVVCEARETTVDLPIVTDSTWQSLVLESESPVLVEFSAPWCGPCRMIHPTVVDLSKEYAGKFKFYKLNTDESPSITKQYGVRSVPTVIVFKNGEKKDAVIGAVPKTTLVSSIEKFL